jgi:hypothetical protein
MKAYWFIPLGVATTIPAPGTGSGWIYFVSKLRAGLAARAWRTVHGRARAALAPALHLRKDRLVIIMIIFLPFRCVEARDHNGDWRLKEWQGTDLCGYAFLRKMPRQTFPRPIRAFVLFASSSRANWRFS